MHKYVNIYRLYIITVIHCDYISSQMYIKIRNNKISSKDLIRIQGRIKKKRQSKAGIKKINDHSPIQVKCFQYCGYVYTLFII